MTRQLRNTIVFCVIGLVMIMAIQKTIDIAYNTRSTFKFNRIFQHKQDAQITVFGSSVANVHFDPVVISRATGLSCYNEGLHGTFLGQYGAIIREYLKYESQCKVLVIACDFDNLGNNDLITRPDLYLSHLSNDDVFHSLLAIEPQKIWCARYLPGYKLCLEGKQFYVGLFLPSHSKDTLMGFAPVSDSMSWNIEKKWGKFNARYDDHIYKNLKEIISLATSKGIHVVTVLTPVFTEGQAQILNIDFIRNKYREAGKDNALYHFVDFTTDSICQHKEYFYNYSHMKISGARQFSLLFAKELKRIIP